MASEIGIIGAGFVGQSLLNLFGDCAIYDPARGYRDQTIIDRCRPVAFVIDVSSFIRHSGFVIRHC